MNRLTHLRQTLPVNILENMDYPNIEFVLLDYNSPDGLESWVQSNMGEYIRSGLLKYYKTTEPDIFYLSHSKNMALKLATGDIICMVDSDNFAGPGYAHWINKVFAEKGENTIITTLLPNHIPYRDQGGKLCFHRDLFHSVSGFDESLVGYGVEDMDLVNRLEDAGGSRVPIENRQFLEYIGHSDFERLKNHHLINNLTELYIQKTVFSSALKTVLYLLKDQTFYHVHFEYDINLKRNPVKGFAGWKIRQRNGHRTGSYVRTGQYLRLRFENGPTANCQIKEDGQLTGCTTANDDIVSEACTWEQVPAASEMYYGLIMAYGECLNRFNVILNKKYSNGINAGGWGKSIVYLNSDYSRPVQIL